MPEGARSIKTEHREREKCTECRREHKREHTAESKAFDQRTKETEGTYMSLTYRHSLIPVAKGLRKNATRQENHLWYDFLRTYPVRFQRQKAIDHFIVDFYCHTAKLVVEVDGTQHYTEQGLAYDAERNAVLEQYGLKVIRFSNGDIDRQFSAVCDMVHHEIQERMKEVRR